MKLALVTVLAAAMAAPLSAQCKTEAQAAKATQASWETGPKSILETASAAGSFKTLEAAIGAAGLEQALSGKGPFTVFAPTDAAFAKLPQGTLASLLKPEARGTLASILTFHVVSGTLDSNQVVRSRFLTTLNGQRIGVRVSDAGVSVAGSGLVSTDIQCTNGVIHVIDKVMLPNTNDIIDTAVQAGSFKTLAAALKAAGLVEALKAEGPFTVFAPTDEAFAKLPAGTVESLLKPENKHKLAAILKYHVVKGRVFARNAVTAGEAGTLQGGTVRLDITSGKLMVNDAVIVNSDIETSNGVIHVIDTVLIPN
jgi:uncharacterized surface protein with fasciclin (FAS1) repeats